ncbi:MAG: spondin domain-containing protein [Planctomycetota bacterium]
MRGSCALTLTAAALYAGHGYANTVSVTVENLQAPGGLAATPIWFGAHDGSFDLFDVGSLSNAALEAIAEDGNFAPVAAFFASETGGTGQGGVITSPAGFPGAPVFEPGESVTQALNLAPGQRFLTLAAMVLPSNDAFIGTDNAVELFDAVGNFLGPQTLLFGGPGGAAIYDGGTEANTELDAAFLNQGAPDTGETESNPISLHPGFIGSFGGPALGPNGETGSILGGLLPNGETIDPTIADFTSPQFGPYLRVTIEAVPSPNVIPTPSAAAAGFALLGALAVRRRRRREADDA